jgi:hypothetical protein
MIARKVSLMPQQADVAVSLKLNDAQLDAFPVITVKEEGEKYKGLYFKQPVLVWDEGRQNVSFRVRVTNRTSSAIWLQEDALVQAICCMYDKAAKFEDKVQKPLLSEDQVPVQHLPKSEHGVHPVPLFTENVKVKTEASETKFLSKTESTEYEEPLDDDELTSGVFENQCCASVSSSSAVFFKQECEPVQENAGVTAMDDLDSFEVTISSFAEGCVSPLQCSKVLFEYRNQPAANYFNQLQSTVSITSPQNLAESLIVDKQICAKAGKKLSVKVRNLDERLCLTVNKGLPLTVSVLVEHPQKDVLGPALPVEGLLATVAEETLMKAGAQQVIQFSIISKDIATVEIFEQLTDGQFWLLKQVRPVVNGRFFASVCNTLSTEANISNKISIQVARIRKITSPDVETDADAVNLQAPASEPNKVEIQSPRMAKNHATLEVSDGSCDEQVSTPTMRGPGQVSDITCPKNKVPESQRSSSEKTIQIPSGGVNPLDDQAEKSSSSNTSLFESSCGEPQTCVTPSFLQSSSQANDRAPSQLKGNFCLSKDGQLVLSANPVESVRLEPGSTVLVKFLLEQDHSGVWENFKNLGLIKMHTFSDIVIPLQTATIDKATGGFYLKVENMGPKAGDLFQFMSVSVSVNPREVPTSSEQAVPNSSRNTKKDEVLLDKIKTEPSHCVGYDSAGTALQETNDESAVCFDSASMVFHESENDSAISVGFDSASTAIHESENNSSTSVGFDSASTAFLKTENDSAISVGFDSASTALHETTIESATRDDLYSASTAFHETENDCTVSVGFDSASTAFHEKLNESSTYVDFDSASTAHHKINDGPPCVGFDVANMPFHKSKNDDSPSVVFDSAISSFHVTNNEASAFDYVDSASMTCPPMQAQETPEKIPEDPINSDKSLSQAYEAKSDDNFTKDSIYVGNLPVDCTAEKLKWLFNAVHPVSDVEMKTGLKSHKQYAHVKFKSSSALDVVLKSIHSLSGKRLILNRWKKRSPDPESTETSPNQSGHEEPERHQAKIFDYDIWIGGLPLTEGRDLKEMQADLRQLLTNFGPVASIEIRTNRNRRGCHAVASFATKAAAKAAIAQKSVGFRSLVGDSRQDGILPIKARACHDSDNAVSESHSHSNTKCDIWVGNLPSVSEQVRSDLHKIFRRFGTIQNIAIQHASPRQSFQPHFFAFITFASEEAVELAVNAEPIAFYGRHILKIEKRRSITGIPLSDQSKHPQEAGSKFSFFSNDCKTKSEVE